jgi:hypothetical protein
MLRYDLILRHDLMLRYDLILRYDLMLRYDLILRHDLMLRYNLILRHDLMLRYALKLRHNLMLRYNLKLSHNQILNNTKYLMCNNLFLSCAFTGSRSMDTPGLLRQSTLPMDQPSEDMPRKILKAKRKLTGRSSKTASHVSLSSSTSTLIKPSLSRT